MRLMGVSGVLLPVSIGVSETQTETETQWGLILSFGWD